LSDLLISYNLVIISEPIIISQKSRFKPRTFPPMNTDPDHLHYLTAATPAAEGGVGQPALAVKDRGERSVCRKVPSVADSSAEHGSATRESLKSTISLSPEPIREGHRSLSMVTYLASQTYWLNGREPIIIIIIIF
jgi:hypothetical protein